MAAANTGPRQPVIFPKQYPDGRWAVSMAVFYPFVLEAGFRAVQMTGVLLVKCVSLFVLILWDVSK